MSADAQGVNAVTEASATQGLLIDQLAVRYGARIAVKPLTVALQPGGLVALVGPNGAGKTSLLKALAGLLPNTGRVCWNGRSLEPLAARERARAVAYLPQAPVAHWPMTAADLVALGRLPHRRLGAPESAGDREAVQRAMKQTNVGALAGRHVDELSGGERTRVLLARALAVGAPVLLVDEPIASLDPYHQLEIMSVLGTYARSGALVVAVLHDLALAARFCTRMILMDEGAIVGDGTPEQVLSHAALERHYRVQPYLARHEDEPVIVPWRTLD